MTVNLTVKKFIIRERELWYREKIWQKINITVNWKYPFNKEREEERVNFQALSENFLIFHNNKRYAFE